MERHWAYKAARLMLQRVGDTLDCWLVLLRARLVGGEIANPRVEHCIQLKKGTRFHLVRGQVELDREEER